MVHRPALVLPLPEPLAVLDATLLFVIQVLLAQHPELLTPPEEIADLRPPPPLRAARRLVDAVRELSHALDSYRDHLPARLGDDDFPF